MNDKDNENTLITNNHLYNVALFIDYENVYLNLLKENRNVIRDGFFEKIREWCKKNHRRLVKIAVYCNFDNEDLHNSFHQSLLQSYGVESIHTSNQGKNFADLQITIDVLNAMHLNHNIDEFMIMSNDKDMTPLLNSIRYNKRKVSVITVGTKYNDAICSFSDEQIKYEEVIKHPVASTYIAFLEDKIEKNLCNTFERNKSKYIDDSAKLFQHIGLEYFCEMQMKQCNLMIYEVYNCIKSLQDKQKAAFYCYNYKATNFIGICPYQVQDYFKSIFHMEDSDFIQMDMESKVSDLYAKYRKDL